MNPIWRRRRVRCRSFKRPTSAPSTKTEPSSGVSRHPSRDNRVVFPLPDGPITSVSSPGIKLNHTSLNAGTRAPFGPYQTLTPSTARLRSGTKHSRWFYGERRAYGKNRRKHANSQRRRENRQWQPGRRGQPRYRSLGLTDHRLAQRYAQDVTGDAAGQGLRDNHPNHESVAGPDRLERRKFLNMLHGGGINRLGNDGQADDETQQRGR